MWKRYNTFYDLVKLVMASGDLWHSFLFIFPNFSDKSEASTVFPPE